jgi:hypothetical protein
MSADVDDYDVIVIGAGMAGLCCAGELVMQGRKPLLISESKEVGYLYRSVWIGGNRCLMQHPARQSAWGGGWWFDLVRRMNVNVTLSPSFREFRIGVRGAGVVHDLPICPSAAAVVDMLARFSPLPIDENRAGVERVLEAALAIPYEDLVLMQEVPLLDWCKEQGADDSVTHMMLTIGANFIELKMEEARERLSVFGTLGPLRAWMCGEGEQWVVHPDPREGLCIPIAKEIERRGGTIWRGRKVEKVDLSSGRPVVIMKDGTTLEGCDVAMAYGTSRVAQLLDPVPEEVAESVAYEHELDSLEDYSMFSLLDKPCDVDPHKFMFLIDEEGSALQCTFSLQAVALSAHERITAGSDCGWIV